MNTELTYTQKNLGTSNWSFIAILAALMAFTSLSIDVYLPAMPKMEADLKGSIELTITSFLVGFMLAQLVWGPISDRIGRKRPLQIGLILFIIGSIGCALSQTLSHMIFWRVIQAFGACTGPMIARAMVRDRFERTEAAHMMSTLIMVMAAAPIIGPLLGGQLLLFSSWHSIFWMLAVIGVFMLYSLRFLPETLPQVLRVTSPLSGAFKHYAALLTNRQFMAFTLCVTSYYVGAYGFIVGSPKVYIEHFSVAPQHYGWLFAVNIVGVMGVSYLNRLLVKRVSLETLLVVTTGIAFLAAVFLLMFAQSADVTLLTVALLVFVFFSTNGVIAACATTAALDLVPKIAGSAAALIGALQYGSGILSSFLLAITDNGDPRAMAWIMFAAAIASLLMAIVGSLGKKTPA